MIFIDKRFINNYTEFINYTRDLGGIYKWQRF